MADINVFMVTDGTRFNFGPPQSDTLDDSYFGLTTLLGAMTDASNVPSISVYTAHRRRSAIIAAYPQTAALINYPEDFLFTGTMGNPVNLADYDVIWLVGDEGINVNGPSTTDVPLTPDELNAIATFMQAGGGVFAVGDHDGIGSYMCRHMMRVRTMRRWVFGGTTYGGNTYPSDAQADATGQTLLTNWTSTGSAMNLPDRNDTLRHDAQDGLYYFNDQSDQTPQPVLAGGGTPPMGGGPLANANLVHSVMRGAGGVVIANFPDHMHEGEATDFQTIMGDAPATPFNPNDGSNQPTKYSVPSGYVSKSSQVTGFTATTFDEFPMIDGFQPVPEVVAWGSDLGHATINVPPIPDVGVTNPKNRGIVSVYDGRPVGVGRIITGSTFHHYLDKNLIGDPQTASADPMTGPTGSDTAFLNSPDYLDPIKQFYLNAVAWLARRRGPIRTFISSPTRTCSA